MNLSCYYNKLLTFLIMWWKICFESYILMLKPLKKLDKCFAKNKTNFLKSNLPLNILNPLVSACSIMNFNEFFALFINMESYLNYVWLDFLVIFCFIYFLFLVWTDALLCMELQLCLWISCINTRILKLM